MTVLKVVDDIELCIIDKRYRIYDWYNDFSCSFNMTNLNDMIQQFQKWYDVSEGHTEYSTHGFYEYGYSGNWVKRFRIPMIISMLRSCVELKKRKKSELKRLATSTIIKEFKVMSGLLGDNIKRKEGQDETSSDDLI